MKKLLMVLFALGVFTVGNITLAFDDGCYYGKTYSLTTGALCSSTINPITTNSYSCTDSDGGININVKGFTDGRVNGLGSSFTDVSVSSNGDATCSGTSCTAVAEGYCSGGLVTNFLYQCPSGYSVNGACAEKVSIPSLTILTPNGGETYTAGQQITVKWNSNNISSPENVLVEITRADQINNPIGTVLQGWIILSDSTPNDGVQTFLLDKNITPGKYELAVRRNLGDAEGDISDNLFTINSPSLDTGCSNGQIFSSTTGSLCQNVVAKITPTSDLTPRISYYPGKVNQHVSISEGMWQTDSDGTSGSDIDKLTYCKKWYPNTTSVVEYKNETINAWHDAGNVNDYPSTRMSYKCVQSTSESLPNLSVSLDSTNPFSQTIAAGSGNVIFARLKIKAGSKDVNNLNKIQISSDLANSMKLNSLAIYDGNTKIGGTNYGLTYNGSYYQTWVTLNEKLLIPANTSKVLSIVADIPPVGSSGYFSGNVRLGVSGWTFDYPGANVSPFGTSIYGNMFTIVSSTITTPSITVLSPNGGEVYIKDQPIKISLSGGLYLSRVGLVYPDFNPNNEISDGNDVHWLSVSSDAGKSFVWDGSSFIDINGNKNYFTAGTGNYKILAIRDVDSNQCYKSKISNCIFDISDNVFTIKSSSTDNGCSNGQIFSSTTGARCRADIISCSPNMPNPYSLCSDGKIEPNTYDYKGCVTSYKCSTVVVDNGCNGTRYSTTTGKLCGLCSSSGAGCYNSNTTDTTTRITRTLRQGVTGDDVKKLQEFLGVGADGVFGRGTAASVKAWQVTNGLVGDGLFGYQSRVKANLNN